MFVQPVCVGSGHKPDLSVLLCNARLVFLHHSYIEIKDIFLSPSEVFSLIVHWNNGVFQLPQACLKSAQYSQHILSIVVTLFQCVFQ